MLGVTWTFAEPVPPPPPASTARLTVEQAANLRQLAAIGYVGGIRERLDALEAEAPEARAAIAELRGYIADYRLDAFMAALPEEPDTHAGAT